MIGGAIVGIDDYPISLDNTPLHRDVSRRGELPVLFLIFSRLEKTRRSFEAIKGARPRRLYVAADGPRLNVPGEDVSCAATLSYVLDAVDWDCQLSTLVRVENLGCTRAVTEAIDWFFTNEEAGIIIEDDCVVSSTFFDFCASILRRYSGDGTVLGVTGWCFDDSSASSTSEFGLSQFPCVWGWATWRDVWKRYDSGLTEWSGDIEQIKSVADIDPTVASLFGYAFDRIKQGKMDTWVYQLFFLVFWTGSRFAYPTKSLVRNIGFDLCATHQSSASEMMASVRQGEFSFPGYRIDGFYYDMWQANNVYKP